MSLPEPPSVFHPTPARESVWWWRLLGGDGAEVEVPEEYADQRFPSQSDAESWIGEFYPELTEVGVESVVLLEHDREVYGPMSLSA
ncbi:hypothetical protein [Nocardioides insulae]|uniref:hypothetical protein n=1 Tax=Nocardioides insulae TaxID=394734 RepID=UPI0004117D52|nr:hypothetical protein [Nocardioides insulae]